jgi:hypothetical protein
MNNKKIWSMALIVATIPMLSFYVVAEPIGVAATVSGLQQGDVPTQPLRTEPPPVCTSRLADFHVFQMQTDEAAPVNVRVELTYDSWGRKVSMMFSYYEGVAPDYNTAMERVVFPTSYYPTSAIYIGDDKVAISGKDAVSGLTIVEVWSLSQPSLYRFPSQGGGPDLLFLRGGRVDKVDTGFAPAAASGFGLIKAMWRNRRLGGQNIFALTCEGRDLYSLDLAVGVAVLVISSDAVVGPVAALPALEDDWLGYSGPYKHDTIGDVYKLNRRGHNWDEGEDAISDEVHSLFLLDSDYNGSIDSFLEVSPSVETALGLGDIALWELGWQ